MPHSHPVEYDVLINTETDSNDDALLVWRASATSGIDVVNTRGFESRVPATDGLPQGFEIADPERAQQIKEQFREQWAPHFQGKGKALFH